jgi:hypothetical protein
MKLILSRFVSLNLMATLLAAFAAPPAQADIVGLIRLASSNRCEELVKAINEQVSGGRADVLMYAGNIHEYGTCVNPDWEKATAFYQKAAKAGAPSAVPRMVALYAVDQHDPAAALWWAAQNPKLLPKDCIPIADPLKNAVAFLEELRIWPAAQLNACTYHAGIMSRILAKTTEWKLPGMIDTVMVNAVLNLDTGAIEWSSSSGDALNEGLASMLDFDGVLALREFGKPPSNDPRWTKKNTFAVEQRLRPSGIPIEINVAQ